MATPSIDKVQAVNSLHGNHLEASGGGLGTMPETFLESYMYFLEPDSLWETEKPYGMRYHAKGIAQSNVRRERHRIVLNDIRSLGNAPSVDVQGFSVMPLDSRMTYEDFYDYAMIKSIYHEDLVVALKKKLGAKHVFIMDNAVCVWCSRKTISLDLMEEVGSP